MTLIVPERVEDVTAEPGLHALVIGVGAYPHLEGGTGKRAAKPYDLTQLRTPIPTARAIVQWLEHEYQNSAKPLRSIELLLSPHEDDPSIERATMERMKAAAMRWSARCSLNRDNVAFFYFCGHGLNPSMQLLLPEDFADPHKAQWDNCIDLDDTVLRMKSCLARTQLFFIDACSNMPAGLDPRDPRGVPLVDGSVSAPAPDSGVYYAAREGQAAFGPSSGITYFGQAVLKCFAGAGCQQEPAGWVVTLENLGGHLHKVLKRIGRLNNNRTLTIRQHASGDAVLHHVTAPFVMSWLDCSTKPASYGSEMMMRSAMDKRHSPRGDKRPWLLEVPPGAWHFEVTYAVHTDSWNAVLMPPVYEKVVLL